MVKENSFMSNGVKKIW